MYIASAVIETEEYGTQTIVITDKKKELLTGQINGQTITYLGYEAPLADNIFKAAARDTIPIDFFVNFGDHHGMLQKYTITKYTSSSFERVHNKYRKDHIAYREKLLPLSTVHVYAHHCRCFKCFNEYGFGELESFCGLIPLQNNCTKLIPIDMHRCPRCNKMFVESTSLALYEQKYGKLALKKTKVSSWDPEEDVRNAYFEYAPDSILSRNGYKASLPTIKRWEILSSLIERGVNKAEIKDHLSWLIKTQGIRCYNALPKWEMDLEYVNNYGIENQRITRFY